MSDLRLRELERTWRESGAAADEAAWLRARVRAGDLAPERLDLCAELGHEAALLAGGVVTRDETDGPAPAGMLGWFQRAQEERGGPFVSWARRLAAWEKQVAVRAALAAARAARPGWEREHGADDVRLAEALRLVERWAEDPSPRRARAAGRGVPADDPPGRPRPPLPRPPSWRLAYNASRGLVGNLRQAAAAEKPGPHAVQVLSGARWFLAFGPEHDLREGFRRAEATLREAARAEVVPWALGYERADGP